MKPETKEEFVGRIADLFIQRISPQHMEIIKERVGFDINNKNTKLNEEALIEFLGELGGGLVHMLPRLQPRAGFSSTLQNMSLDDLCELSRLIVAHVGAKILCSLCDQFDGRS